MTSTRETATNNICGVKVGEEGDVIYVRASRSPFLADGVAAMTPDQWRAFVDAIKRGELDHIGQA